MRAGKIAGVKIILNNWFLFLIILFIFAGMADKVLLIFSALIFHELAHILAATALGYKVKEVEILPFGAVARIEKLTEAGTVNEIIISIAGPLVSFMLAALSYAGASEAGIWRDIFLFYFQINLMLALFNLLPALPLDGGRILRAILSSSTRCDYRQATRIVILIGYCVSVVLLIWAGGQYWFDSSLNLTAVFAAFFLYASAKSELDTANLRLMRHLSGKKSELAAKKIMPVNCFTTLASVSLGEIIRQFKPETYSLVLVLDENFREHATLTETQIWEAMTKQGINTKISDIYPYN